MEHTAKELDFALEAIKYLSIVRTRPYFSCIAKYLRSTYNIPTNRTVGLLKVLLLKDKIRELVYNGKSCFRIHEKQNTENYYVKEEMSLSGSVVAEVLIQLCRTNASLRTIGVTENQLQSALSLKLARGTKPCLIKQLIEKEFELKTITKNQLGNFIMNPNGSMSELTYEDDSLSDSDSPETRETDSTTTERTVDSLDIHDSQKSEENSVSKLDSQKSDDILIEIDKKHDKIDRSLSPSRLEELESSVCVSLEKAVGKGRKKRTKGDEDYRPECETPPDRSPSPQPTLSKNTGRRIIRKKTKYDPSEYYLTPLVRKKKEAVTDIPKVKLKRGRPPYKHLKLAISAHPPKKTGLIKECKSKKQSSESKEATPEPTDQVDKSEPCERSKGVLKSKASSLKNQCYICCEYADIADKIVTYSCSLCLNIAHKECVTAEGVCSVLKKWRCEYCLLDNPVICSTCDKEYDKNGSAMLMCDFCEEFYHAQCHDPPVKLPLTDESWRCSLCPNITIADTLIGGREDLRSSVGTFAFSASSYFQRSPVKTELDPVENVSAAETNRESVTPVLDSSKQHPSPLGIKEELPDEAAESSTGTGVEIKQEMVEEVQERREEERARPASFRYHRPGEPIPTVNDWTPKQVAEYFTEKFGTIVGNAFLSQEIDGSSLLLLSREHVTDQLGLHFGIALKVLYYVKKIQLGTNLYHKLWT